MYGASGSVGSYAVQLAKELGASVTGVCSTKNVEIVLALGAQEIIDYTKQDYSMTCEKFDVILDAVGKISKPKKLLEDGGAFVSVKMLTKELTEDLLKIKELAEIGAIKPLMDNVYSLDEIVDAHAYVDEGH